jgi:hypothetical protein
MNRYYIARFSGGTENFLEVGPDDPEPYPLYIEVDEDTFRCRKSSRNAAWKKSRKEDGLPAHPRTERISAMRKYV